MTLTRYLDAREVRALGSAPVHVVEFRGRVDEDAMARSLELLCIRYPIFRARVRREHNGYLVYATRDFRPDFVLLDGDESTMQLEAENQWDPERGVVRLILVRGATGGFQGIRIDHGVFNGSTVMEVQEALWNYYTCIVSGSEVSVKPQASLPRSPSELHMERWGGASSTGECSTEVIKYLDLPQYRMVEKRFRLSEQDTSRLISAARSYKTSVHALICGAILVAQREHGTPPLSADAAAMWCRSPVELRNRDAEHSEAAESTLSHRGHMAKVLVSSNGDPVSVGSEVKKQLDDAIARHHLPSVSLSEMVTPSLESALEQRLANVHVTNSGVFPQLSHPAELTIVDWRFVSGHNTPVAYPCYGAYTYNGRLSIYAWYPSPKYFTHDEVERLAERIKSNLEGMLSVPHG